MNPGKPDPQPCDLSRQAVRVGRVLDRKCRAPGQYAILITVPTPRSRPWRIEVVRVEPLQRLDPDDE